MEINKPTNALNLDVKAQKEFMKYYNQLDEKSSTTVRFFDRIDYYTCHGENDTETISKIVFKTTAYIKHMAPPGIDKPLPYICLTKGNFETAVRDLLLVKQYRVEVFTKESNMNDWKVRYRGSPGNLIEFEDILFSNNEIALGSSIIAIQLKVEGVQKKVGIACIDQNDCQIFVNEFFDDDFFAELEAITVLLGPRECILPSEDGEFTAIKTLMERNGVMVTIRNKNDFHIKEVDIIQDLNHLIRFAKGQIADANSLCEVSLTLSMKALAAIIKYLDLTSDAANLGNYEMKQLNVKRYVHLDAAAISALNILPKLGITPNTPGYHWQSILGVVDYCRTPQGHRLMSQWVKQPLRNMDSLNDRHDIVECFLENPTALTELHDEYLKKIPDIQILNKKLLRKKANLQDLFRIFQVILRAPSIVNLLYSLKNAAVNSCICDPFKANCEDLSGLKQMIEQVIDLEMIKNGEYLVKPSFDEDLKEMREQMDSLLRKMDLLLSKACDDLELESKAIKLDCISHLGHCFRVSLKDDAALRKSKKYTILDAVKSGVRFTSDKLSDINSDFIELKEKYEHQQKTIVDEVIKVAVGYLGPLTCFNRFIAEIDCLTSFAIAARLAPKQYIRPKILQEGSGILNLQNVRHPCLELQETVSYIANSVNFQKDETTMFIITGPNMGGKSTYIRSVGVTVLMALIGSFVPCDNAIISMVDSILGRIGASDNISKGLSTFMVEMIETSAIIRNATVNSLVIIDELGRGTSTYEGCGIAWSIAEYLAKEIRCFVLFATHFHEITELSKEVSTVSNCHMSVIANSNDFVLLFKVCPGVMARSFGIQVARLANFPEKTVKMAEKMFDVFDDQFSELKNQKDIEFFDRLEKEINSLANGPEANSGEIEPMILKFVQEAKGMNSEYMKAAFPDVLQ